MQHGPRAERRWRTKLTYLTNGVCPASVAWPHVPSTSDQFERFVSSV